MSQGWAGFLLLLVLVDLAVLVALLFVLFWAKGQSRQRDSRSNLAARESPPPVPVVGPAEEIVVQPLAAASLVIGPSEAILVAPSPAQPLVIGPSREEVVVISPAAALTIEPPQRAAWDDRGWMKRTENGQEIYEGVHQIADRRSRQHRRFRGAVVVSAGEVLPYIADPPAELRRHPKHPCFQLSHPPWFKMHWQRAAGNVDDAILYLERVLDEAINGRRVA